MSWHKLSLVFLGLALLLVLLGGPLYIFTGQGLGASMWGMMQFAGNATYGWLPMMAGIPTAYYLAAMLVIASFVTALIAGYRHPEDAKQGFLFIGVVVTVGVLALFVPGAAWIALGLYVISLILFWR